MIFACTTSVFLQLKLRQSCAELTLTPGHHRVYASVTNQRSHLHFGEHRHYGGHDAEQHVKADEELVEGTGLWLGEEHVEQHDGNTGQDVVECSHRHQGWKFRWNTNYILTQVNIEYE